MLTNVFWLGHDSFRIVGESSGVVVYIDPWKLSAAAPPADLVLVTHDHYDHFSVADIATVTGSSTVLVGPAEVTSVYRGESRTVTPGDVIDVAGVGVEAVAAYNVDKFKSPGRVFHPREDGKVGFIVTVDGRRYYHAGDSDAIPEMATVDVDVAMLPVSGTYVMTPDEAAAACETLRAGLVVPMHYDTIVGSADDARRFAASCRLPVEILPRSER